MSVRSAHHRFLAFVFIVTLLGFAPHGIWGCSGASTPGAANLSSGISTFGGGATEEGGSSGVTDDSATPTVDTSVPGTTDALPQASIPTPALQTSSPISALTVASAENSSSYTPVVGYDGAGVEGDTIIVTSQEISASLAAPSRWLIPTAFADTTEPAVCSMPGVLDCCTVQSGGGFACYPIGTNSSTYYIYQYDGTTLSEPIMDTVNTNVLWLTNSPVDLAVGNNNLYSLTTDSSGANYMGVKGELNDSVWSIFGSYAANYLDFSIDGSTGSPQASSPQAGSLVFDYDATSNYFGVTQSDGVKLYKLDTSSEVTTDPSCKASQSDVLSYTALKYTGDNKLRYSLELSAAKPEGKIYYALDGTACDPDSGTDHSIKFVDTGDLDSNGIQMTVKKEIAFDVMNMTLDHKDYVIVAYENGNGQTFIRAATNDGTSYKPVGGESPISGVSSFSFKDIQFYHAQPSTSETARALILDSANNMVWNINVDTNALTVDSTLDSTTNGVAVGAGAIAMAQNSDHTRAYVLNSTDSTVSVLTLVKSDGTTVRDLPAVVATVTLADLLPGKTLTFSPSTLQYKDGYLLVGDQNLKSNLVINASSITETTVADSTVTTAAPAATGRGSKMTTTIIPGTHITVTPITRGAARVRR